MVGDGVVLPKAAVIAASLTCFEEAVVDVGFGLFSKAFLADECTLAGRSGVSSFDGLSAFGCGAKRVILLLRAISMCLPGAGRLVAGFLAARRCKVFDRCVELWTAEAGVLADFLRGVSAFFDEPDDPSIGNPVTAS